MRMRMQPRIILRALLLALRVKDGHDVHLAIQSPLHMRMQMLLHLFMVVMVVVVVVMVVMMLVVVVLVVVVLAVVLIAVVRITDMAAEVAASSVVCVVRVRRTRAKRAFQVASPRLAKPNPGGWIGAHAIQAALSPIAIKRQAARAAAVRISSPAGAIANQICPKRLWLAAPLGRYRASVFALADGTANRA